MSASPVRTARRRILQVAGDLYLHAISDRHMQESLRQFHLKISRLEIRRQYHYLANLSDTSGGPALSVQQVDEHDMWTARILPTGVDLITGALFVSGVRKGDPAVENLALKKDIRRGLLAHLAEKPGEYIEDVDLAERFIEDGFYGIDLPEIQYQLWYLSGKKALTLKDIRIGPVRNYTAKITSFGCDLTVGDADAVGVSES